VEGVLRTGAGALPFKLLSLGALGALALFIDHRLVPSLFVVNRSLRNTLGADEDGTTGALPFKLLALGAVSERCKVSLKRLLCLVEEPEPSPSRRSPAFLKVRTEGALILFVKLFVRAISILFL